MSLQAFQFSRADNLQTLLEQDWEHFLKGRHEDGNISRSYSPGELLSIDAEW